MELFLEGGIYGHKADHRHYRRRGRGFSDWLLFSLSGGPDVRTHRQSLVRDDGGRAGGFSFNPFLAFPMNQSPLKSFPDAGQAPACLK